MKLFVERKRVQNEIMKKSSVYFQFWDHSELKQAKLLNLGFFPKPENDCFFINVTSPGGVIIKYDLNQNYFVFTFL